MRDPKKIPDDIRAAAEYLRADGYSKTFLRLLADAADEMERAQAAENERLTDASLRVASEAAASRLAEQVRRCRRRSRELELARTTNTPEG